MKKITALILSVIMTVAMSVPAFAFMSKEEIVEKTQGYIKDIDIDYLTKYKWYYGGGVLIDYIFEEDGICKMYWGENDTNPDIVKYTLEDNILTFHYENEDQHWIYVNNEVLPEAYKGPYFKKENIFYIPSEDEYLAIGTDFKEVPREKKISVTLNGKKIEFDQKPLIKNDRTLVPLRKIFEALGASVEWDQQNKTVTATKDGTLIMLTVGKNILFKNGKTSNIDIAPEVINDRTMVPVRVISESFGCNVEWDQENLTVKITN